MLKVWDWMSGALRYEVAVADVVYPYIKVAAPKVKSGWDEEGEGNKGKKGKKKGSSEGTGTPDPATTPTANNDVRYAETDAIQTQTVLAIQKIETTEDATGGRRVLFSVTGYVCCTLCMGGWIAEIVQCHRRFLFPLWGRS